MKAESRTCVTIGKDRRPEIENQWDVLFDVVWFQHSFPLDLIQFNRLRNKWFIVGESVFYQCYEECE